MGEVGGARWLWVNRVKWVKVEGSSGQWVEVVGGSGWTPHGVRKTKPSTGDGGKKSEQVFSINFGSNHFTTKSNMDLSVW